jgi:hypothetical protein
VICFHFGVYVLHRDTVQFWNLQWAQCSYTEHTYTVLKINVFNDFMLCRNVGSTQHY